jgi:hypothetical protein
MVRRGKERKERGTSLKNFSKGDQGVVNSKKVIRGLNEKFNSLGTRLLVAPQVKVSKRCTSVGV